MFDLIDILTALIISYSVQIGYGPSEYILWEKSDMNISSFDIVTTAFDVEAELKGVFIGGGIRTPAYCRDKSYFKPGSYCPLQGSYDFGAGYRFKAMEIGYKYTCQHPVMPYYNSLAGIDKKYEGSFYQVYIRVENSFCPFK